MKRLLHWIGGTLAIVGGVFVVLRLRQHAAGLDFGGLSSADLAMLGALALFYGAANILLALAWRQLLVFCTAHVTRLWAVYAYGVSQLAKYIPGNIFHVAGRQMIGMAAGHSAWALARSTIWELGVISVTGGLFGLLALGLVFRQMPALAGALAFILALAGAIAVVARLLSRRVALAMAEQALFLALSGAVFVGCLIIAAPELDTSAGLLVAAAGAFVLAWLGGLVTPGAPAGLGVREVILLFLLADVGTEPEILMAVLLGRIVNVAGDVAFFVLGTLIGPIRR